MAIFGEVSIRRFFVEGLVIVASILAAFGIQAWWDDRLEREEEQRLLIALHEECQLALEQIDFNMRAHEEILAAINALLSAPLSATESFEADSLDRLIAQAQFARSLDFQTATLNSILFGGRLAVIDSPALREGIAAWQGALDEIADVAAADFEIYVIDLRDYLVDHANMAQTSNALRRVPGSLTPLEQDPVPEPLGREDHFELLRQTPFRNTLLRRRWAQEDLIRSDDGYPGLRTALVHLIELLEQEIERSRGAS